MEPRPAIETCDTCQVGDAELKLVHFSDLHLDAHFAWLSGRATAARARRQALRNTLVNIARLVVEERADALLCGGDLFEHDRVTPDTEAFVRDTFANLDPIPVFLTPGNHDWLGQQSLYARAAWSPNVHVFEEDRLTPKALDDGLTLWGAAHRAPANTDGFLNGFRVDRGGINVALFHGSEASPWWRQQEAGTIPHAPFQAVEIRAAGLAFAFLGHYHTPRDAENYSYPGNPDPLTFGEDGPRGAVVATIRPDGSVALERRRVAVSQVHDIQVDISGCTNQQDVRERVLAAITDLAGMARVTLSGDLLPDVDLRVEDLGRIEPPLDALVVRLGQIKATYDFDAIVQQQTVRGQFVRDVLQAGLNDDQRRRVLITGLRALDGRDDLEVP